jgi:hypothetical protein
LVFIHKSPRNSFIAVLQEHREIHFLSGSKKNKKKSNSNSFIIFYVFLIHHGTGYKQIPDSQLL